MPTNPHADLPLAPGWSLLLGSTGRALILAAVGLFVLAIVFWLFDPKRPGLGRWGARAFVAAGISLVGALGVLLSLFLTGQFQFAYVFSHSDKAAPLAYKIAGVWGGQEGSFLLWAVSALLFGLIAAPKTGIYRRWFTISYAGFLATLAAILAYESPFKLNLIEGKPLVPPDGAGLTPALMNYWVTIHPPTIFLGFGAGSVLLCWALAALLVNNLDDWVKMIRPWAILATTLLGLGLCMGGFWAYETLGWGGFWAWDPVENTSFVPWCLGVAFIHGLFVQAARRKWHYANAMLAAFTCLSFWYGTFLTRSGFLGDTSVHSFAEMDRSALWILTTLKLSGIAIFLTVWTVRLVQARRAAAPEPLLADPGIKRDHAYGSAAWLLTGLAIAAGFGMSVPLAMSLTGRQPKVVEEALYHQVVVWLFVPIMILIGIGPFLSWRGMGLRQILSRTSHIFALALGFTGFSMIWARHPVYGVGLEPNAAIDFPFGLQVPLLPWMAFLVFLCMFAFIANAWRIGELWRRDKPSLGGLVSHTGIAILMCGLIVSRGFERSEKLAIQEGQPARSQEYTITYKGPTSDYMDRFNRVRFEMVGEDEEYVATPGLYYIRQPSGELEPMVWPHIQHNFIYDTYFTLGPMQFEATEPLTFKKGETKRIEDDYIITYQGMTRKGEAGMQGAEFGARLRVESLKGVAETTPTLRIGKDGLERDAAPFSDDLIVFLDRVDAKDESATIQLHWSKPVFPVELFYKPMTGLVWLGTGIMTLGGFLAAWYRRRTLRATQREQLPARDRHEDETADAPLTTAQV